MTQKNLRKILFIDDDNDILSIIKYAVSSLEGVTVYTADEGQKGVDTALKENPDLIVLDVMMPGMDGLSVYKALRLLPSFRAVPIVFLTAKVQEKEIEEYISLGAVGVLTKPFDPISFPEDLLKLWAKAQGK